MAIRIGSWACLRGGKILCGAIILTSMSAGCGLFGGGLDSKECKAYFAKVDECVGKANAKGTPAGKVKAESWKTSAEVSKANFKKNANPLAVKKSCEMMMESMAKDSDCQ